jgi:DNA-binding response OmpR family regulator
MPDNRPLAPPAAAVPDAGVPDARHEASHAASREWEALMTEAGTTPKRHILVVEDEPEVARLVERHLVELGHRVTILGDGRSAFERARREPFDLIILDLMLPGMDGLEVCRALRAENVPTPILVLTAKSTELDRIVGLEFGADDYMVKPFSVLELLARVKAIFRRVDLAQARVGARAEEPIHFGEFVLDPRARTLTRGSEPIALTAKEFDLLYVFAANPGRVYTRAQLLDLVWGYGDGVYEANVTSHINRLRAKVERDPARPVHIQTVWGVGYRFGGGA